MNTTIYFDIETDNLLDKMTVMHCGVTIGPGTQGTQVFRNAKQLTEFLDTADIIVGHNAIGYDIPALKKLVPGWSPKATVKDTLIQSRLTYPDRALHPAGGSSLDCWGQYLKMPKGDHTDFSQYSAEMVEYCIQDVAITQELYRRLFSSVVPGRAAPLEHRVAEIVAEQTANGFGFDTQAAEVLYSGMLLDKALITEQLQQVFPPREFVMKTKTKYIPFNPGSRDQIAAELIRRYKWKPTQFTETGKPQIDESILKEMPYPEARLLEKYLMLEKRLGQVSQWLEANRDGVIHGSVNTNGAVSGRMTHSGPNLAQVPRCSSEYGPECRSLFRPTRKGWVQVGIDASGLELRMLAHYLAAYDNGEYAKIVCTGDVHTHNMKAAGLQTRDQAKTFIYGVLYGAGDAKVGSIIGGTVKDGRRLRESFKKSIPAYDKLSDAVSFRATSSKQLTGLDGRILPVRSAHSALNLLLQSAGAVVMKMAVCLLKSRLDMQYAGMYAFMANIHDEWQIECHPEVADQVGQMAVQAIKDAGVEFAMRCPLDGQYKVGSNWKETH